MLSWPLIPWIRVGPLSVYTHSLGIFLAYLIGALVFYYRTSRRGLWKQAYGDALVLGVPGVLLGSRLGWALPFWLSGQPTPEGQLTTLVFTHISFLGGVLGGMAIGLTWLAVQKARFRPVIGLATETILLGLAIARIGDLLVADHLGALTTWPIGFRVPSGLFRPNGACLRAGDICHQTALYEFVIACALLFGAFLYRRRGASEKAVAAFVLIGYGALRFVGVEPFRVTMRLAGLTGSQWTCLALVVLGLGVALRRRSLEPVMAEGASEQSEQREWAEDPFS